MAVPEERAEELARIIGYVADQFTTARTELCQHTQRLNPQDLKVVTLLGNRGPLIMREIAEHMGLVSSSITAIIDKLVQEGFVRRDRSERDRRIVQVSLTDAGRKVHAAEMQEHRYISEAMLTHLTEDEQVVMVQCLRKIVERSQSSQGSARSTT